mgnify:CR=1 FL=1
MTPALISKRRNMKARKIALVEGDGSGPEMMAVACEIAIEAAKKDGIGIVFEETPMGWNAYHRFGDTLPVASLERAIELGTIFFGGVGDFENDSTIGKRDRMASPDPTNVDGKRAAYGCDCIVPFRMI